MVFGHRQSLEAETVGNPEAIKTETHTRDLARAIEVGLATASPYLIEIEL